MISITEKSSYVELLTLKNITKRHGDDVVLDNISLVQYSGQKVGIAGETGSGKTTLMKIAAGLAQADSGEVLFDGKQVKGVHEKLMPGHKGIAYLSQHFELRNNHRIAELLTYANDLTDEESEELYNLCRVDHLLNRWSQTLSGGERQRVALAKLLTEKPRFLILDEPFSNLDNIHKQQLKNVIADIGNRLSLTCAMISHDATDLLPWADEIVVMKAGKIIQQGPPKEIYEQPETEYTAGLMGKYNLLPEVLIEQLGFPAGTKFVRPEQLACSSEKPGFEAVLKQINYYGSYYELRVSIDGVELLIDSYNHQLTVGQNIFVRKVN